MAKSEDVIKKRRQRLSVGLVQNTIREKRGNVSAVARTLGWSRSKVDAYIRQRPTVFAVLQSERETMVDNVESEFYRVCLDANAPGHVTAMIFFLKTRAQGRGYVERLQLTGTDNEPIQFVISERHDKEEN